MSARDHELNEIASAALARELLASARPAAAVPGRLPTSAEINALPARVRTFIHDLETRCDPAGDVQRLAALRDSLDGLMAVHEELRAERDTAMARLRQIAEAMGWDLGWADTDVLDLDLGGMARDRDHQSAVLEQVHVAIGDDPDDLRDIEDRVAAVVEERDALALDLAHTRAIALGDDQVKVPADSVAALVRKRLALLQEENAGLTRAIRLAMTGHDAVEILGAALDASNG